VRGANYVIGTGVKAMEQIIWAWTRARIKELKRGGMKVVAVAGSYGKTSVKHNLYELLRRKYRVVATPESFNTTLGIAECLKWEVDPKTEIFVVEVAAYHVGEITHLLGMILPDIGVLTGMARQHLEKFGSWEKIIEAKSEIAGYMKRTGGQLVANGSDETVKKAVAAIGGQVIWYGRGEGRLAINLDGAKKVAQILGATKFDHKIRPTKNRFEMTTERYGMAVIDDSFSSNDRGFLNALKYLGKQTKRTRILVTPGIVELGELSNQIHEELGRGIVGSADIVILVGDNERTRSLERGIGGKVKIYHIAKTLEFMQLVAGLKLQKEPLVLLENDVTENY
jgi:UDP-N-acetylmuramoyl-tripeptide--D-alanyl-D-alanine ligase